jgi:TolA-binding protein
MKKIFFLIILVSSAFAISAFEAGDLDSPNPYGLTKDEKYIWQNKQDIKHLQQLINAQQKIITSQSKDLKRLKLQFLNYKMKVDSLSQKVDGISSMFPSFDSYKQQIQSLKDDLNSTNVILFSLKDEINKLKENVDNNKKLNDQNMQVMVGLVESLAKKIDGINKKLSQKPKDFRSLAKSKILTKAINLYKNGKYNEASDMFDYLYKNKYKPATSLFYLGEIAYKQGRYKIALSYYKKSITLYPKPTKFTPILLYHTGYSFERLNKYAIAKKSYQKIIKDFPKSAFAKYAQKRLQKLASK